MQHRITIVIIAIATIAAMSDCRRSGGQIKAAPWWGTMREADFSGIVPIGWPLCEPFVDEEYETVRGFLVVEKIKDHANLKASGVEVGDIILSWATRYPEVPETLREAWLDFLNWGRSDEDVCWLARDQGGRIEVFPCDSCMFYECMVALGTFGLALRPTAFPDEEVERITAAAEVRKQADMEERAELLTLSPPLQENVRAFTFAFKTDDDSWRGRVDTMDNNLGRLALWRHGRSLSAIPDFVSEVAWRPGGSDGNGSYESVGAENAQVIVRLSEFNHGSDDMPPLLLEMWAPNGDKAGIPARKAPWQDLRMEQAVSEPNPFTPEQQEQELVKTPHPSLLQTPFEPVLCFEADDGTIAGRIDRLPTKRLGDEKDVQKMPAFDDSYELYRIMLFECPVRAGDEPKEIFYATRRINGAGESHTYVDVTWWYSLDVSVQKIDPPGAVLTDLRLNRWSIASPELGFEMCDSCIPAHPIRWKDVLRK